LKSCNRCKREKQLSFFSKNASLPDGLCAECKDCAKARAKNRYKKEGEKLRFQMAELRKNDYLKRIEIERKSRQKRKEFQRPLKNARQQARNRLLADNKFEIKSKDINRLYQFPCFECGSKEDLSIDHVIPLVRGGNHSIGNLMTLCRKCNSSKGKKFLVEWKKDLHMKVGG